MKRTILQSEHFKEQKTQFGKGQIRIKQIESNNLENDISGKVEPKKGQSRTG